MDIHDILAMERWKFHFNEYGFKVIEYGNFRAGLYSLIYGQCTDALQDKLKSHKDFDAALSNGIALLKIIKLILYSYEHVQYPDDKIVAVKEVYYVLRQGNNMTLRRYHELFLAQVMVMNEIGVTIPDEGIAQRLAKEKELS